MVSIKSKYCDFNKFKMTIFYLFDAIKNIINEVIGLRMFSSSS